MSFISRLRRSRQHRVSILSAYLVHPFPLRGTSPRWEACHWIRGSRGSPMNPVPLPPQGETRDMKRKTGESYASCTTPAFPPLVAGATTFPPRWEACHWILSYLRLPANPVPLPPPQFGGAAKGKRLNGQARRLTSPHLEVLCRTSTGDYKAPLCCELLMKGLLFRALFCPLNRGGKGTRFVRKQSDLRIV